MEYPPDFTHLTCSLPPGMLLLWHPTEVRLALAVLQLDLAFSRLPVIIIYCGKPFLVAYTIKQFSILYKNVYIRLLMSHFVIQPK